MCKMRKKQEAQSPASPIKKVPQKKRVKKNPGTGGAPSIEYTEEMGKHICDLVAKSTTSLENICKANPNIPSPDTIYTWRLRNKGFSEDYLQAKREQAFLYQEETIHIANDDSRDFYIDKDGSLKPNPVAVARDGLKIKTRNFHAGKLLPKIYGDRAGEDIVAQNSALAETVALLQSQLAATKELNKAHEKEY